MIFPFIEEKRFPTNKERNDWVMYHQIRSHLYDMHVGDVSSDYSHLHGPWEPICPQCFRTGSMVQGDISTHTREGVIISYYCVNCEYQYDYETVM